MATTSYIFSYLVLVLAGMSLAFQQVLNSNLQTQIGSPWMATAISYFVGLATALVMTVEYCLAIKSFGRYRQEAHGSRGQVVFSEQFSLPLLSLWCPNMGWLQPSPS